MTREPNLAFLVVAAGRGLRAGLGLPKQYRLVAGKPLLTRTLEALHRAAPEAPLVCVIHPDDRQLWEQATAGLRAAGAKLPEPAIGARTRQSSVLAGLKLMKNMHIKQNFVFIHDAARCFVQSDLINILIHAARAAGAAIPVCPLTDAITRVDPDGCLAGSVSRDGLFAAQTPQVFALDLILDAHVRAAAAGRDDFADDAAVAQWAGHAVTTVPGDPANVKITHGDDFRRAEARLLSGLGDIRIGHGFDVHALVADPDGAGVRLGGLDIPFHRKLDGHSDADVVLHAITDAVLGALADGDIGVHFPPSDPQWRGAASRLFLEDAVRRVGALDGALAHIDVTIIAEAPKIGPHRDAMRASIATIAGVDAARVAVKATTTERLGFTGRGEGIAAQAVVTLRMPLEEYP